VYPLNIIDEWCLEDLVEAPDFVNLSARTGVDNKQDIEKAELRVPTHA
jgi:hypothetical protein